MYFFLTLLLKSTLILVLSGLLLLFFRNSSASLRHWIISLSMIGLLVLPFFNQYLPHWEVEMALAEEFSFIQNETVVAPATKKVTIVENNVPLGITNLNSSPQANISIPSITETIPPNTGINWVSVLFSVWIGITMLLLASWIRGTYQLIKLTRASEAFTKTPQHIPLGNTRVLIHSTVNTPMTWGFLRPVILLPKSAETWSTQTTETVLIHELSHIQRGDYLMHLLSGISVCLYWFHPMIWWMKQRQQLEREKACDEFVLKSGLSQQGYAEQLVLVARQLSNRANNHYALPMAQVSQLKKRILAILDFQKEGFRFTKFRQFQWAGFYVGSVLLLASFTPVEPAQIMELVSPESEFTQYLQTEREELIQKQNEETTLSTKQEFIVEIPDQEKTEVNQLGALRSTVFTPTSKIGTLKTSLIGSTPSIPTHIGRITPKEPQECWQGTWKKGKSTYRIWTYGEYSFLNDFPYVETDSPEAMIIIEEKRKTIWGTKTYLLTITRAPYDGGVVQSYVDGHINSWQGGYKEDDRLYLFTIDGEWRFLGKGKVKWIANHLQEVCDVASSMKYTNDEKWKPVSENDPMLQQQKEMKSKRFMPYNVLPENNFERGHYWQFLKYSEEPPFDFHSVPYQEQDQKFALGSGKIKKIGRTKATKTMSGGNTIQPGYKFGTLIYDLPAGSSLKDFQFHLRENDYEKLTFELNFYYYNQEGVTQKLSEKPIVFSTSNEEPWIKADLSNYGIVAEGNVLAVMELKEATGRSGDGYIFFSLGKGAYTSFHELTGKAWGFWENNFASFLTVEY